MQSRSDKSSSSRQVVWQALIHQAQGRNLPDALAAAGLSGLEARERAFTRRLAAHAVRHRRRLELNAQALLKKPSRDTELLSLIVLGLAQLDLNDVAQHAAVHATVELASKRWRSLINAVLRRRLREGPIQDVGWGEAHSFPDWLVDAFKQDWSGQAEAIMRSLNQDPVMCLRVNRQKTTREDWMARLPEDWGAKPLGSEPGLSEGLCLQRHVALNELPGFAGGEVSIQGACAQAAIGLLQLSAGQRVLDACAAPGGKTAHMLEQQADLDVRAMDIDVDRLARVDENLQRLGLSAQLIAKDVLSAEFEPEQFDRILLDVPCSGTGVIARHPDIKWLRRADDIAVLAATQQAMLQQVWPWLKPGGQLLYCSCSILNAENDEVIAHFLASTSDASADALNLPFGQASEYGWRVAPQTGHEGFYYSRLVKA